MWFTKASIRVDLLKPFDPSTMKISPSLTFLEMKFNNILILEIVFSSLRLAARVMARSFLYKSYNF